MRLTTPLPTPAAILASSFPCSSRSWVAHAVELARTVSSPSLSATGCACSATSSPTSRPHWAKTRAVVTLSFQPRSVTSRETSRPSGCGSRGSAPGPDQRRRRGFWPPPPTARRRYPGEVPRSLALAFAASSAAWARSRPVPFGAAPSSPCVPEGTFPGGLTPVRGVSSVRFGGLVTRGDNSGTALSTLSTGLSPDRWVTAVSAVTRGVRLDLAEPGPACSATRNFTIRHHEPGPGQLAGHVFVDRGGHQHLFGARGHLGQPGPALAVQLGEHVVEQQHRLTRLRAQQLVAAEAEGQRERPRLAVARVALGRRLAQDQLQLVPVRADEADPALELRFPSFAERLEEDVLEDFGLRPL